ncbi:sugar phosphate isomerase/epimerase [uncultured Roseibium sp.]|uniref:sugar phosphate isomerase/epimerase family protein n=1 Tax=uncultured Roseibium sp. TaxID=1936171 RepID=UPI0032176840
MLERITHTGFSAAQFGMHGDLAALDRRLGELVDLGAEICELNAVRLDAVSGCRLMPQRISELKTVLARHVLRYTLHGPIAVNLMDEPHLDLQVRAAEATLELASECEANIVVLHPGRVPPALWVDQSRGLLARERETVSKLADRAQALGVKIAYENMSPNRRIIAGTETSYALDLVALADQVSAISHPALVACLDVSHAQQGALLQGFDMYEQAEQLAPHVGHIHFSDSTGVPSTIQWDDEGERLFFGIGDMHAPPGFGAIDFDRLAKLLRIQESTAIAIELRANHYGHSREQTLAAAKAFAETVNALN